MLRYCRDGCCCLLRNSFYIKHLSDTKHCLFVRIQRPNPLLPMVFPPASSGMISLARLVYTVSPHLPAACVFTPWCHDNLSEGRGRDSYSLVALLTL